MINKKASIIALIVIACISGVIASEDVHFSVGEGIQVTVIRAPNQTTSGGGPPITMGANEIKVCTKVYYFIVQHLDTNGKLVYTFKELQDLSDKSAADIGTKVAPETLMGFVENYNALCKNYTNLKIPAPAKIPEINLSQLDAKPETCSPSINVKILWGVLNLDTSIPNKGGGIVMGEMSCGSVNFWKWFFKFNKVGDDYSLIGLRFYWIVIILIMLLVGYLLSL